MGLLPLGIDRLFPCFSSSLRRSLLPFFILLGEQLQGKPPDLVSERAAAVSRAAPVRSVLLPAGIAGAHCKVIDDEKGQLVLYLIAKIYLVHVQAVEIEPQASECCLDFLTRHFLLPARSGLRLTLHRDGDFFLLIKRLLHLLISTLVRCQS